MFIVFIHLNYTVVHFVGQVLRQVGYKIFKIIVDSRFMLLILIFLIMQTKQQRDEHITSVHTLEKSFSCKICPSKFSTSGLLRGKKII